VRADCQAVGIRRAPAPIAKPETLATVRPLMMLNASIGIPLSSKTQTTMASETSCSDRWEVFFGLLDHREKLEPNAGTSRTAGQLWCNERNRMREQPRQPRLRTTSESRRP